MSWSAPTPLHVRGVALPEREPREFWITGGRLSTEPVPGAETVVDGGYLLPGFVDAHCHTGIGPAGAVDLDTAEKQAVTERDVGALLLRDCGAPIDTRALQERTDLPWIIRCGRHLARPRRYIPGLAVELEDQADLPKAVAGQATAGDGWVKLVGDWIERSEGDLAPLWDDDVLAEAIAVAHRAGARVTAHVFGEDAMPGLVGAGIDCIEHGTGLTPQVTAEMARRGTALVPTLVNIENFPGIADSATKYPRYARHMRALHATARERVAAAVEAGVAVYAGTDAGGNVEHGRVADEIAALAEAGMGGFDALGAACWAAREWLGRPGLTEGAPADLLAFTGDPTGDLRLLAAPERILLRGAVFR
jgi:imidazolonepropionase-like amidohydrolase